ncbi:uncharacterized protein [Penaeus vannamei]|uniref:uncharacterized protein n=1 Tax=Penaeus vannamei TaxID=6689 RepID=UPI00387F4700
MTALEVLERKGARLEETTTDGGDTPLHLAASEGHLHVVFLLLSLKVSPQPKNRRGKTPQDVLKRPSATTNCTMEIFRDISKTQIMEKWIESERERSNLTREVRTQQVSARWRSASRPPGMRQGGVQCGNNKPSRKATLVTPHFLSQARLEHPQAITGHSIIQSQMSQIPGAGYSKNPKPTAYWRTSLSCGNHDSQ